ncbi:MAG: hypothetical protein DPW11_01600 [bacterium]|nr:hypothetical protein [Candidatus Microgenomates bacterium CPR3]MCQ3944453.1 hypothetical protein [bacterium]RIK51776.1 MAG: hypothetical protein DCC61_01725 [Candidatus Microgenomates bacterium]
MTENIYDRINRTLSWKRVLTFNLGLFLILIIPLSVRLAQEDTENRSGAAGEIDVPVVTPPPSYPVEAPRLDRVSMFFGKKGDTIVLIGNNFGDYQWGSSVYVGNSLAPSDAIVRWSNSIIEVKIPETARSGKVWLSVNGRDASWDGNLLLYDETFSTKVGLNRISATEAQFVVNGATKYTNGLVELGYVSEPLSITALENVAIESQTPGADALGKKMQVRFSVGSNSPTQQTIFNINHPGIGAIDLVRVELYGESGNILPLFADPLAMKVLP